MLIRLHFFARSSRGFGLKLAAQESVSLVCSYKKSFGLRNYYRSFQYNRVKGAPINFEYASEERLLGCLENS